LKSVIVGSDGLANNASSISCPKSASIIEGIQIASVASTIPKIQQQKALNNNFKSYFAPMKLFWETKVQT
jgi:hypothetical protein